MIWGCKTCGGVFDGPILKSCPMCGRVLPGRTSRIVSAIYDVVTKAPVKRTYSSEELDARDSKRIGLVYSKIMRKRR